MVSRSDFADFYFSDQLKEQIRSDILREVNVSFEEAKADLFEQVKNESERHRRVYVAQAEELTRQLLKLREELDFIRELVVDANYQRNSNDDIVSNLQKRFDALEIQLRTIEEKALGKESAPEIPAGGRKL
ncbi:hypothetical protein AGMMS50229_03860 [Campylobacterota bacterium]|nr:hypothetical protein AGMMS50229_03860 [Campylobacterota bacterium]